MNLLVEHFNAIEKLLLAKSRIAANSGHPLHKGNAREVFIREFLADHIGSSVRIGTGEIISHDSNVGDARNQFDVVLYNASFPKINYSSSVHAFLVESVNTTIEVKSTLDKKGLEQAIKAASRVKRLDRNVARPLNPQATVPPRIYNFLVAYDCNVSVDAVYKWWAEIDKTLSLNQDSMPSDFYQRNKAISQSLDFIVILGKGAIYFDNLPVGVPITKEQKESHPENRRLVRCQESNNIYLLFLYLVEQIKGIECDQIDLYKYYEKIYQSNRSINWEE
jgi:hypothetical protein